MAQTDVNALNGDVISRLRLPQRLALSYAPRKTRAAFLAYFALDNALGEIIRQAREPMLAQIRLAWWRDMLANAGKERPQGNLLVELVKEWPPQSDALSRLVDGWESLLVDGPMDAVAIETFANGRAECFSDIACAFAPGCEREAREAGKFWALVDLREGLSNAEERALAHGLAMEMLPARWPLPRALRPLLILSRLAHRALHRSEGAILSSKGDMLAAVRLGLVGC